jgi:hypothetical protein
MAFRWTTSRLALAAGAAVAALLATSASEAQQPTCDELDKLRALFNEAYKDEQDKRYDQALEKFRIVERCKASPSVRYRIASVLEAQGKLREARDGFRAIAAGDRSDPKTLTVVTSSEQRAGELDKRIPKLVLKLPSNMPADAVVTVDNAPIAAGSKPIDLDPGEHTVQASAPTARQPFASTVKLGEGGQVTLQVVLEGAAPPTCSTGTTWDGKECVADARPPDTNHTLAYVALGGGAALVVVGVVLFVVRKGDIDDIHKLCPNLSACPSANRAAVNDDRSQANLFLPLGIGVTVVGVGLAGLGAYMLLKPTTSPSASLRVVPRYVRGGGVLGMETAF